MNTNQFQLAKQYDEQIQRLRKELLEIDKCTHLQVRAPYNMSPDYIPSIERDLNEFPRMKAAIKTALEEELKEYEKKFNNI